MRETKGKDSAADIFLSVFTLLIILLCYNTIILLCYYTNMLLYYYTTMLLYYYVHASFIIIPKSISSGSTEEESRRYKEGKRDVARGIYIERGRDRGGEKGIDKDMKGRGG